MKKEMEFENKLRASLEGYGFSLRDIINILDPQKHRTAQTTAETTVRRTEKQLWGRPG